MGLSDLEILVPFVLISQGIQVNNGFVRSGDFSSIVLISQGVQVNNGFIRSGDFSSICPNISGYTGKQSDPENLDPFVLMSQGIQVNPGVYLRFPNTQCLENLGYLNSILSFICIPS